MYICIQIFASVCVCIDVDMVISGEFFYARVKLFPPSVIRLYVMVLLKSEKHLAT